MRSNPVSVQKEMSILVCGNPGAGKSSICNALVNTRECFPTASTPDSVTKNYQCKTTNSLPFCDEAAICDVPGLLEAGDENEAHNAQQLRLAVDEHSKKPTTVFFVCDASGRIHRDDVEAYEAICKDFLQVHGSASCVLIANRAPNDASFRKEWEDSMKKKINAPNMKICFVPHVDDEKDILDCLRSIAVGTAAAAPPAPIVASPKNAQSKATAEKEKQKQLEEDLKRQKKEQEEQAAAAAAAQAAELRRKQADDERKRQQERQRLQAEQERLQRERDEAARVARERELEVARQRQRQRQPQTYLALVQTPYGPEFKLMQGRGSSSGGGNYGLSNFGYEDFT